MRTSIHTAAAIAVCTGLIGCAEDAVPALILEIDTDLAIPYETNSLAARLEEAGEPVEERVYALGDSPRDQWPQTLPIVAGARRPDRLDITIELRYATPGLPSAVVGFGTVQVDFPREGQVQQALWVERSCVDNDGDGFGVGFGCLQPDCDDTRRDVPREVFCSPPAPPVLPDAGVSDVGFPDAGSPDAEGRDGGVPDTEPVDAGEDPEPEEDAGRPDSGVVLPDAGIGPCNGVTCGLGETCFMGQCLEECEDIRDCDHINEACLDFIGVCICRVPCTGSQQCGGLFACVDGCCEF